MATAGPLEPASGDKDGPSVGQSADAEALALEITELRYQLQEAQDTLEAIQNGDVDALIVGSDIYTLDSSNAATNKLRQDVLAQMEDAVMAFDAADHLVFMNPAAELHYRAQASEYLGRSKREIFEEVWPDGDLARRSAHNQLQR